MTPFGQQVGVATAGDVAEIASLLHEGAAWMTLKGCPAWTPAMISAEAVAAAVARGEFVVASQEGAVIGACTLTRRDPVFWPEDAPGEAAYVHRLAVRRAFAGRRATPALFEWCSERARGRGCRALRLDCHPILRSVYERLGFSYVDTRTVADEGGMMVVDRLQQRL